MGSSGKQTKLHIRKVIDYKRIIYLDSDTIILRNVDSLFSLPKYSLYLPSIMMVIEPHRYLFSRLMEVADKMEAGGAATYDMDLINNAFGNVSGMLLGSVELLTQDLGNPTEKTHWFPWWIVDQVVTFTYAIHFSSGPLGNLKPRAANRKDINWPQGQHPMYQSAFEIWWDVAEKLCSPNRSLRGWAQNEF
ncbi:uncharacterized protein SPPG_08206 [Spizellomyces punctatus DAOM BR117]|uniref:Glycosyltransferase family 8 protein n=1 Tax=Spizellomyces punctatus (strain DAOM BR117) TaxID=645134 RepID=A0A0L0H6N7_SPIPD|nr:uncharacterized protein SPPG_08206 [Spizellomyces punctatus DAOM BR117]KNC96624.1 hypothetical protein SPPG_08206 [Spizellomyces punctatus DAOM BR117]|eukprot:XP_016604664.1 hypothetical protein SPPG_08206 [Spizellomyces punctatus DAOM BR117]